VPAIFLRRPRYLQGLENRVPQEAFWWQWFKRGKGCYRRGAFWSSGPMSRHFGYAPLPRLFECLGPGFEVIGVPAIRRYRLVGAGLLFVAASTLAFWGLVGAALKKHEDQDSYYYIFRLPQWLDGLGAAFGIACAGMAVCALAWLLAEYRIRRWHDAWWLFAGICWAIGAGTAVGARIVTDGTNGANIGGGMILLASPAALIICAVLLWQVWRELLKPR